MIPGLCCRVSVVGGRLLFYCYVARFLLGLPLPRSPPSICNGLRVETTASNWDTVIDYVCLAHGSWENGRGGLQANFLGFRRAGEASVVVDGNGT